MTAAGKETAVYKTRKYCIKKKEETKWQSM